MVTLKIMGYIFREFLTHPRAYSTIMVRDGKVSVTREYRKDNNKKMQPQTSRSEV